MRVSELVETLDPALAVELYALKEGAGYESLGLFRLDMPASADDLLDTYGNRAVKQYDTFKAYVLVYLEGTAHAP